MSAIRCTVCKLPQANRAVIDAALSSGAVSLDEISARCQISKSSLHRHSRHAVKPDGETAPVRDQPQLRPVPPAETIAARAKAVQYAQNPRASKDESRAALLERIELLWNESLNGIEASKEPIVLSKPDGSTIEIKGGDLRARAAFVGQGCKITELFGRATGLLENAGEAGITIERMIILMPGSDDEAPVVVPPAVDAEFTELPPRSADSVFGSRAAESQLQPLSTAVRAAEGIASSEREHQGPPLPPAA